MDIYKLDSLQKKLLKNIQKQYGIRLPSKNKYKYKSLSKSKKRRSPLQIEIKSGGGIMEDDLIIASENGNLEMVKKLVERGADVNTRENVDNNTPLMYSIKNRHSKILQFLVSKGADVNAKNNVGDTALILSSKSGNLKVVKFLVDKGADVNAKDDKGNTALIFASQKGHLDIVKFLVDKGADVNVRNKWGDKWGDNALIYASHGGHLEIVKYLVEKGADFRANENEALVDASSSGHLDIVKYLVEKGANVNAPQDNMRYTSLIFASQKGHLDIVIYLVEKGADVRARDNQALIKSSENGHFEIVIYLVENGADVRARDDEALISASEGGHLDIVKYLVEKGADVRARNNRALTRASQGGHLDVVKYLKNLKKYDFNKAAKKILSLVKEENKDFWYKWQSLCSSLDEKNIEEIRNIANIQGISTNGKSKREMCVLLSKEYTKQMLQTPECINEETMLGDPVNLIPKPLLFTVTEKEHTYCFNIIELLEYINKGNNKNPWTRSLLPIDAIKERMVTLRQILLESKFSLVNILDEIRNNKIMTKESILRLKIVNLIALLNYTPNIEDIMIMSNERVKKMFEVMNGNSLMRTYGKETLDNLINESLRILQIDDNKKDTRKAAYEFYLNAVFKDE